MNHAILPPDSTTLPLDFVPPLEDTALSNESSALTQVTERVSPPRKADAGPRRVSPQIPSANSIHTSIVLPPPPPPKIVWKKKFRPPAPVSFSSPLKAPSFAARASTTSDQGPRNHTSFSSPIRPPRFTHFPPFPSTAIVLNNSLTRANYPLENSIGSFQIHTNSTLPHSLVPESQLGPIRTSQTGSKPNLSREQPHMLTPSGSKSHQNAPLTAKPNILTHPQPLAFHRTNREADIFFDQYAQPSTFLASVHKSKTKAVRRHPDLNTPNQLPPSSPIHSFSPTPSPSPRPKRATPRKHGSPKKSNQSLGRQKGDTYNLFRSDPDDEWSTLPVRKKAKAAAQIKPRINGVRTTAAFRLPGASTKGKVSGISATSERRVVTFLPPPLKSGKVEVLVDDARPAMKEWEFLQPDVDEAPSRVPKHSREPSSPTATPKRRRLSENPYPSPANSRLTPGAVAPVVSSPNAVPASSNALSSPLPTVRSSMHRIPSPPTSDPIPEYDVDIHAGVAVGGVSERYPRTKALMRQRKHGADDMWDLLDLPSCGIVHQDDGSTELPVIVWEAERKV
ncbi:hypothetical protein DFH07DRAFT_1061978 [Mycena maculata]|uniref:Uncharacterized protein n=1 Tax=Mycena maculata TaxID=230809 RepID=A0AAD7IYH2_9AGAR|nr:hypothetical protein DFH07DRAFT_1061978 [Mycena maculata]